MSNDTSPGLEQLAKIVALAASLSLPASVIFDWGFFNALNLSMRQVPTSLLDHARSAVLWFPLALVSAGSGTMLQMILVRVRISPFFNTSGKVVDSPDIALRLQQLKRKTRLLFWPIFIFGLVLVIAYLLFGDVFFPLLICGVCFLWFSFGLWSLAHPGVTRHWTRQGSLIALVVPVIVWFLWSAGHSYGIAVGFAPLSTRITLIGVALPRDVAIIRYMDKGLLVRTQQGGSEFLQWSGVTSVDTTSKYLVNEGLLCRWLHMCDIAGSPAKFFKEGG